MTTVVPHRRSGRIFCIQTTLLQCGQETLIQVCAIESLLRVPLDATCDLCSARISSPVTKQESYTSHIACTSSPRPSSPEGSHGHSKCAIQRRRICRVPEQKTNRQCCELDRLRGIGLSADYGFMAANNASSFVLSSRPNCSTSVRLLFTHQLRSTHVFCNGAIWISLRPMYLNWYRALRPNPPQPSSSALQRAYFAHLRTVSRRPLLERMEAQKACALRDSTRSDNTNERTEEPFRGTQDQPCNMMWLETVLVLLRLSYESLVWNDESTASVTDFVLQDTIDEVHRLRDNPQLFETTEVRSIFFRRVRKLLKQMEKYVDVWAPMEAALLSFEVEDDKRTPTTTPVVPPGEIAYSWAHYCRNRNPSPTRKHVDEAMQARSSVRLAHQQLPRGGYFILERWRLEGEAIIDAILEVRDSREQNCVSVTLIFPS